MKLLIILLSILSFSQADDKYGTLIFQDDFERNESQETKDEPGNGWTTNSDSRAKGNKQTDLRNGHLYVFRHKEADHAATVNREIKLKDGTVGIKLKFEGPKDNIHLNFADPKEKSVHAGHLFHISINPNRVMLTDLKTGQMDLKIRPAYQSKTLSEEQKKMLKNKSKIFRNKLETGKWHQVYATISGDEISVTVNGKKVGSFKSPGFGHEKKLKLRLHVAKSIFMDDVKIWKKN